MTERDQWIETAAHAIFDEQYPRWHIPSVEWDACLAYAKTALDAVLPQIEATYKADEREKARTERDQWIETACRGMWPDWDNEWIDDDWRRTKRVAMADALDAVLPQIEAAVRAEYEETPPIPAAITRSFNAGAKAGRAEVLAEVQAAIGPDTVDSPDVNRRLRRIRERVREIGASS